MTETKKVERQISSSNSPAHYKFAIVYWCLNLHRSHPPRRSIIMFSGDDVYRPSFFEMIAADRLIGSLKPSLHHLTTILSRRHSSFNILRKYNDELYYILTFILE